MSKEPIATKTTRDDKNYIVQTDNAIIDGTQYKLGDTVKLDPVVAKAHQERGVGLTEKIKDDGKSA